jgi:hypothetical protein
MDEIVVAHIAPSLFGVTLIVIVLVVASPLTTFESTIVVTTEYFRPARVRLAEVPAVAFKLPSVNATLRSCSIRCWATAIANSRSLALTLFFIEYENTEAIPRPTTAMRSKAIVHSRMVNPDSVRLIAAPDLKG